MEELRYPAENSAADGPKAAGRPPISVSEFPEEVRPRTLKRDVFLKVIESFHLGCMQDSSGSRQITNMCTEGRSRRPHMGAWSRV